MAYTGTKVKLGLGEFGLLTDVALDTGTGSNHVSIYKIDD